MPARLNLNPQQRQPSQGSSPVTGHVSRIQGRVVLDQVCFWHTRRWPICDWPAAICQMLRADLLVSQTRQTCKQ